MEDEEQPEPSIQDIVEESQPQSLMEQLRAKREEIAGTRDTLLTITGYEETGLLAKHRLISRHDIENIGRRVSREIKNRGERNMRILVEQIIDSTSGFYYQLDEDAEVKPLPPMNGSMEPFVMTWSQLAEQMGWDGQGGERGALYYIFANNEFAIGQYGFKLNRWMGNTGIDVDAEFLGEGV